MFRFLNDYNFFNKRVLTRCDFNVAIEKNKVIDDFKIQRALPTIRYLKESGAKIILASHLEKESRWQRDTLKPVALWLEKALGEKVLFASKPVGRKTQKTALGLKSGQILLLENLRNNKGETKNSEKFARELAALAEVYVGEAFSACHREHSSIVLCPKFLPHFVGLECEREIKVLSSLMENPVRPLVVIVGGAKVESKIKMLKKFLPLADHLLFGGKTANVLLGVKGQTSQMPQTNKETLDILSGINLTDPKIHLPLDVLVCFDKKGEGIRQTAPGMARKGEEILDIGPATVEKFSAILQTAKTIFWAGAMGMAENPKFKNGSLAIAKAIAQNESALKIAGGGDTAAFVRSCGLENGFSYLSTGGSALLEFIVKGTLLGIEALKI